jgi:hypothetical protein
MNIPNSSTRRCSNCRDDRGASNSNEGQEVKKRVLEKSNKGAGFVYKYSSP